MRARAVALAAVAVAAIGGAGFSLAQDQDAAPSAPATTVAPAAGSAGPGPSNQAPSTSGPFGQGPQNVGQPADGTAASQPPAELAIPPAEESPAVEPAPSTVHAAAPASSANAIANAIAEAPPPPPPPPKRPRYTTAVLQALDKVTAETLRFEAAVNEPVRYKDLVITVHACETQASDEPYAQTAAHMDVQYQPEVIGGRTAKMARQVYRGWMFGDAPGLHPFEHPIYDLWVIACKTPSAAAAPAAPTPPAGANL